MASLEELRQRIDDLPKFRFDSKTGDGTATKFQVSKFPIEPSSETITVGGSVFGTDGYTLNGTSGVLLLDVAAADGTQVIAEYNATQLNGTHLSDILSRNGDTLDLAAAEALEVRAAGAASYFSFISADVKVDKSKVSKSFMDLAKHLRENYYDPDRQATVDTQVEWTHQDQEQIGD